ncbi:MAG: ribosome-associated translation inhibitor RaiA [bacterium]|nr:ribosome-associated translation inhibitor RaiA [bacterium]
MRIELTYAKLEPSEAVSAYAKKRISLLQKFMKRLEAGTEAVAFVGLARTTRHHRKGDVYYAEASIEVPGKKLRASSTGSDIRLAIDDVKEKLERELRRDKERHIAKRRVQS